jgi:hypothetical protein
MKGINHMIPANEWWQNLQNYNEAVFPAQIIFYALALAAVVLFVTRSQKTASRIVKAFFVLAFGWIGTVFFALEGQSLPAFQAQTFLFVTLAVLFAVDLVTDTTHFTLPESGWRRTATLAGFGLVLLGYPLVTVLVGRPFSHCIVPGSFPCPTTALALVFLSTALPAKRRWLYLVTMFFLLLWAIPFPITIQLPQFGVYEDAIMLTTGFYALVMLSINWIGLKTIKSE